jgi:hypothetical protein
VLQEDGVAKLAANLGWASTTLPTGNGVATAVNLPINVFGSATFSGFTTGLINNPSTVHVYSINATQVLPQFHVRCHLPGTTSRFPTSTAS